MFTKAAISTVALATLVAGQTFTACDPTKKTCPADKAIGSEIIKVDFRNGASDAFHIADGTTLQYSKDNGAAFSIANENQAPTITSKGYIFFGKVDVVVKASLGVGIVTSVTLQSDDLDEIDWEWLGGDDKQVQTNFFSKGCTDVYDRGAYSPVNDPQHTFDTYTIDWTSESVKWIINGAVVRELKAANAKGCSGFPQTPMQVKLGTWTGGKKDSPPGTIEWAGGVADFSKGPYVGYYQSVSIQDYMGGQGATSASEYSYGDMSGTWQSIKVSGGSSSDDKSSSSSAAASSTVASSSGSSASTSASATATESGIATLTSLVTLTSTSVSNSTATVGPTSSGSGSGNGTPASTSSAPTSSTSVVGTNGSGKVAASLALAGAGVIAAFFL
jgi:beta-glucanase (GH16 family)